MAALSLNAVKSVAPQNSAVGANPDSTGAIHQPCNPPWMTRPARKNPTSSGPRRSSRVWWCAVAWRKATKKRNPPMKSTG